jgi:DNA replication protein DnaC
MIKSLWVQKGSGYECKFCGNEIAPRILRLGDKEINCGFQTCECEQGLAALKAIEAEITKNNEMKEAKEKQARINRIFADSCMGDRFKQRTFENFKLSSEERQKGYYAAMRFTESFRENNHTRGLFLYGSVGTGKTHLAAAVANSLMADAIPVLFGTAVSLLTRIKAGWQDDSDSKVVDALCRVPLLIIDDLGKEFVKRSDGWSWAQEQIYQVINRRYEDYLPVVITTNLDLTELSRRLDASIVSRIVEMCQGVQFDGDDYRMMAR